MSKRCKPGFYYLNGNHTHGCLSCFCFGHSSECASSSNYENIDLKSSFDANNMDGLVATVANGELVNIGSDTNINEGVFVFSQNKDIWFNLPCKYYKFSYF